MEAEGKKLEAMGKRNSKKKEPVYKGFLKKVRRRRFIRNYRLKIAC